MGVFEPLLNACGTERSFVAASASSRRFVGPSSDRDLCQPVRRDVGRFPPRLRALWGTTITYKAFYNQVAKSRFADFARTMTSRLIGDMTLKVLGFAKGRALPSFAILSCKMAAPLPSMTACARCFLDASKWSSRRPSNSLPPWISCAIPQPPWS